MSELAPLPDSESVRRVQQFLIQSGHPNPPVALAEAARTAQQAADALGVALGQVEACGPCGARDCSGRSAC